MRKISIVQRRLEAGLDLTQAELRALQREVRFQPDPAESPNSTTTAVEEPLSFFPPLRPEETPSDKDCLPPGQAREREDPAGASAVPEKGLSETTRDVLPPITEEEGKAGSQEGILANQKDSSIFPLPDLFSAAEATPAGYDRDLPGVPDNLMPSETSEWQTETLFGPDALFPQVEEEPGPVSTKPGLAEPQASEASLAHASGTPGGQETLVLFLLQVPAHSGLAACFSASQDTDSPFAGQLRVYSEGRSSNGSPGEASEFDVNLPPEGLVRLSTGQAGSNGHEWALVSLDERARAYATFDLRAGKNMRATAAVFNHSPSPRAAVPLMTTPSTDSGLVLANPTDEPVVVRLSLLDEYGNEVASNVPKELDPLPAGKQVTLFGRRSFSHLYEIMSFRGRLLAEVVGKGVIWAAGLSQDAGVLSFFPVLDGEPQSRPEALVPGM